MRLRQRPSLRRRLLECGVWIKHRPDGGRWAGVWPRYGLAILATLLATLLRYSLPNMLAPTPYLAFYPAVVVAAAFGGMGPGLLATIASLLCVDLVFDSTPGWVDLLDPVVLGRSVIFLVGGTGTSLVAQMQRTARSRERRQAEALRQGEERLRLQWERMPIGCIHYDTAFRFAHVNPAAERIFGFPAVELVGRDAMCLVAPEARSQVEDVLRRVSAGEMSAHSVNMNVTKDGRTIFCEWYNTPLKDTQGRFAGLLSMVQDVTERKAAERALRENQEDLNRAQAVARTGSWRLDVRRNELLWSSENHRIFGIPPGTPLSYETFLATIHPEDRDDVDRQWQAALRGGPYDVEHRIVVNGEIRWVNEKAELEFDAEGRLAGGFGTTQDITERKRLEESLRQAKSAAEAANRAKSQFLANMSHELRTPLSAILGMTELALTEPISPAVRDFLGTAKESADLLLELLNELLDFSRIEAGRFELESAPFHLVQTVEQVVKTLGVRVYEKGLELICDLPDDVPDWLVGDSLRLRQVLVNLLGNAIKFTAKGEIVLRVQRESSVESQVSRAEELGAEESRAGQDAGRGSVDSPAFDFRPSTLDSVVLQFSVTDTGVGIAPEDQQRIFSPFVQADASTTRHYGGSGLGLAIASSLVRLMGGRIWLTSQPGHGSTFHFTVRLGIPQEAPPVGEVALDRSVLADLPVLVVSGNATHRQILERVLLGWSMRPEVAPDVPEALSQIHEAAALGDPFRLILADALLPGIDGFTLIDWLRGVPNLAGPVILMLSAPDRQSNADRCRAADVTCLDKPVSRSELLQAMMRALGTAGQPTPTETASGKAISLPPARTLHVLLAEDTPANQKLVVHLLARRGHRVELALNGQQAVELLQQHDFDVVLMDVQMPLIDGFQATAAIRRLPGPKARVPIIAMTAHALKGDEQRCLAAGMDAYVSKPLDAEELIRTVERLAQQEPPACAAHQPLTSPSGAADDEPTDLHVESVADLGVATAPSVFNLDEAVSRCFGRYEMFQQMVDSLFSEAEPLLAQMHAALHAADGKELVSAAHRLRGTLIYLGAQPATEAAQHVEQLGRSGDLTAARCALERCESQVRLLEESLHPYRQGL